MGAFVLFVLLSACLCAVPLHCKADQLDWRAPPACTDQAAAQQEIERLVGTPLADVHSADFDVVVRRESEQRVTVVLNVQRPNGQSKVRELTGGSCVDAQNMAAIAIAMAITGEEREPEPLTPAAHAQEPTRPPLRNEARVAAVPWRLSLGAKLALDHGALPGLAVGAEGDAGVNHGRLRIQALGAYFGRKKEQLADGRGGEFSLLLGGLLGCFQHELGHALLSGCAGGELGVIKAEGFGLRNPRLKNGRWRAIRADVGVGWAFSSDLRLVARLGISVPLVRQQFVIDDTVELHRSAALAVRALLGVEFWP